MALAPACQTPVVFQGFDPVDLEADAAQVAVPDDDITRMIRGHAKSALEASAGGRLDEARAHWQAHEALVLLLEDPSSVDSGLDPQELESLRALLNAEEVEPEIAPLSTPAQVSAPSDASIVEAASPSSKDTSPPDNAAPPDEPLAPSSTRWLQREVREILVEFGEDQSVQLPPSFMANVERAFRDFTRGARRRWFERALHRMDKYLPTIHGIFSEGRLPESFYYLALVESAFDPNAKSRAGAVGLWQFMPATARHYGLTVRRGIDERRDPRKATRAAREYILDLILEFGDGHSMLLAMAAYNAGEGRVRNRLRRLRDYRDRSFWALAERKLLPAETRRYVPTVIAAAVVGRNRGRFGLNASSPSRRVTTFVLRRPVSIPYVLRVAEMAEAELLALNPDLEQGSGVTPAEARFQLVLPTEVARRLEKDPVLRQARRPVTLDPKPSPPVAAPGPRVSLPPPPPSAGPPERYLAYRVQAGDTWWRISEWSGISAPKLQTDNPRLAKVGLRPGQVVYVRGIKDSLRRFQHVVKRGENLSAIAGQYGVKADWVRRWNSITNETLVVGQRLVIYAAAETASASRTAR